MMSQSLPKINGEVPAFRGLTARSIPENPDVQRETLRLLLQFSASSKSKSLEPKSSPKPQVEDIRGHGAPQSEYQQSHKSTVLPARASKSSIASHYKAVSAQNGTPFASSHAPVVPSLRISQDRDSREMRSKLRKQAAITNVKNDVLGPPSGSLPLPDIFHNASPDSTTSLSRSASPMDQPSVRRSNRARAQPANYYTRIRIGSEERSEIDLDSSRQIDTCSTLPPQQPSRSVPHRRNTQKLLFGRELGRQYPVDIDMISDLKYWKSWNGASKDLLVLAWSPDGTQFAAGSAADVDEHNMQYNKRNNLVFGNLQTSCLKELPDHCIPRPTYSAVNDPYLFMSVTAMQWVGNKLFTASWDKTVKIWDTSRQTTPCVQTLQHDSRVEAMSVSKIDPGILATGTKSIQIWDTRDSTKVTSTVLPFDRDSRYKADENFTSTVLAWGQTPSTNQFLAGGMADLSEEVGYKGHLGLWQARESGFEPLRTSNSQNVFDIKWHSSLPQFATASPESAHSARMKGIGSNIKSIVRVFSLNCDFSKRVPAVMEFSCPALDINEVTFCPTDATSTYVTASCTDGVTYVWDNRKGDQILHQLRHGEPAVPIDHERNRDLADVGVRVALWGASVDQFYTGASDGVLKRWDIRRSPDDVLLENTASFDTGIMCAEFSHDKSHLLVGDSGTGVHVLSSGPCGNPENTSFKFETAPEPLEEQVDGIEVANSLVSSGQLVRHGIFGVGQGPAYVGPFASWARQVETNTPHTQLGNIPLLQHYQDQQLDGPPVQDRPTLDENQRRDVLNQIKNAQVRNGRCTSSIPVHIRADNSADRHYQASSSPASLLNLSMSSKRKRSHKKDRGHRRKKKKSILEMLVTKNNESVDLTGDSDDDDDDDDTTSHTSNSSPLGPPCTFNLVELQEALEEDYWWPGSGTYNPNIQQETV
ncbi:uncharacterized protein N7511_000988 [Penicillium nucicola]|uniref:uncharacterized protein n=1 Tax=Penicillium nucicola TaxID=1850975 RepID=UPI0025458C07|nr:uncharacterized protein N7511_000988 [Penicillium nucicola]KAJ5775977.1 hypothetical protein N7511_000988 [Penicillium nucicola]